jgi:hypothetical protein
MREIKTEGMPFITLWEGTNPVHMEIGSEAICNTFPGTNVDDPGWAHAMILKRIDKENFKLEEVRVLDVSPTGGIPYKREEAL